MCNNIQNNKIFKNKLTKDILSYGTALKEFKDFNSLFQMKRPSNVSVALQDYLLIPCSNMKDPKAFYKQTKKSIISNVI